MKRKISFPKLSILFISALSLFLIPVVSFGATIKVPGDQPTIQAGIDAASNGDTVLVADGTYKGEGNKNLDFKGKAITVQSENGAVNCIIDCERNGRGVYFHTGESVESIVSGFTITSGNGNRKGGGIYCESSSPKIKGCTIKNNRSGIGGGIYCISSSSPTISSCTISGNSASGGMTFRSLGGGIYCESSFLNIKNCIITDNYADYYGGGIYFSSSSPTITNCTIVGNKTINYDGGVGCYSSSVAITNSIFWNNDPNEISNNGSTISVIYSDIKGGFSGLGNIDSDPLFVGTGVYQLTASSPCINSGTSIGVPSTDIDGTPRPQGAGYDMGAYEFFLAPSVPTATTVPATTIKSNSATLNGILNPNGGSSWYYFEYGISTNYESTTETARAGSGATSVPVSFNISGIKSGTTYHYRLVGANNAGTNFGSDQTFVTTPSAPSVTTDPASSVTTNSAILNGAVNPNGSSTTYYFEYGATTSYGSSTIAAEAGSGTSSVSVNAEISGLRLNITYHFRIVAINSLGTTNGSDQIFTTNFLAPSVSTGSATSVFSNSATLNGTINPNGADATYYFEYGITTAYGSTTINTSAGSGTEVVSVNASLTGLNRATIYHYRLVATNSMGTSHGGDEMFTTSTEPIIKPTTITGSATSIATSFATLNGTVNPNGLRTIYYFEYGTTTEYDSSTPAQDVGSGSSAVTVKASISDLISGMVYHYRLVATNSAGTSCGVDMAFYTAIIYVSPDGTCGGNTPCYATIQAAIDAAETESIIRILQGTFDEDIIADQDYGLILSGGWDSTFTTQSSDTLINSLTIDSTSGTVEIDNVTLQYFD